mgnify:CR=1 FL=1
MYLVLWTEISKQIQNEIVEIGKRTNPADTVEQFLYEVTKAQKIGLLQHLLENNELYMVLVFTRTKYGADRVAKQLGRSGIHTGAIHSNRTQFVVKLIYYLILLINHNFELYN